MLLLTASCIPPEIMCPLEHPPAILAPKIIKKPPTKDQTILFNFYSPLNFRQLSCIKTNLKSLLKRESINPEKNEPIRKAHFSPTDRELI